MSMGYFLGFPSQCAQIYGIHYRELELIGKSFKETFWLSLAMDWISSLRDLSLRRISQLSTALASTCHVKFHTALHRASSGLDCRLQSSSLVTANRSRAQAVLSGTLPYVSVFHYKNVLTGWEFKLSM